MASLTRLPLLLAADGRGVEATRGSLFAADWLGAPGQSMRRAAYDGMPHQHLTTFLNNATALARRAWRRQGAWLGRLANRLSVARPGYVEVPGAILAQILKALGDEDGGLDANGRYHLRLDAAESIADALGRAAEGGP